MTLSTITTTTTRRPSTSLIPSEVVLPETHAQRDTIYALATPPGRAGIGIIRISGPHAQDAWNKVVKRIGKGKGKEKEKKRGRMKGREMIRCQVVHPVTGEILDDGMAVFFHGELNIVNVTSSSLPFLIV